MTIDLIPLDLQLFASAPSAELTSLMIGKETTFNAVATPTSTQIPDDVSFEATNETLERPGATKAVGQNDEPVGQYTGKMSLSVEPDPDNIGAFLLCTLGAESIVAATGNPTVPTGAATTITAPAAAGATTLTFASATGYIAGSGFRIDAGLPTQEDAVVISVAANVVTVAALAFSHASGATITPCLLGYQHTYSLSSPRPSFTAQHFRTLDTINYSGCKISQYTLSLSAKSILQQKVTGAFAQDTVATSPTTPAYSTINPFTFQQQLNSIMINNTLADATVMSFQVDVNTGVQTDYPRFGNGRFPYVFPEDKTVVSLTTDLAFETLTQRNNFWGNQAATGPQNAVPSLPLSILINSPDRINANLYYSLLLTFGKAKPISAPVAAKAKDYLKQTVKWKIYMSTRGANDDIKALLTNASSSPAL